MSTNQALVFAGIGSRRTPPPMLDLMVDCGYHLCLNGWTLRSGGAEGADQAFERGARKVEQARIEVYLPWASFPKPPHPNPHLTTPKPEAFDIAALYHPAWPYLRPPVRLLMARNVHQVLGENLDDPVRMVVCYTPDGSLDGQGPDSGGTGMALRVSAGEAPDAVVFNIARKDHRERIQRFCEGSDCSPTGSPVG